MTVGISGQLVVAPRAVISGADTQIPTGLGVVTFIPIGPPELAIEGLPAIDPTTGNLYTLHAPTILQPASGGYVVVIGAAADSVITEIPVGDTPTELAYDSLDGSFYVTHWYSDNLTVVNVSSDSVTANLSASDPEWGEVYFTGIYFYQPADEFFLETVGQGTFLYSGENDSVFGEIGASVSQTYDASLNELIYTYGQGLYSFNPSTYAEKELIRVSPTGSFSNFALDEQSDQVFIESINRTWQGLTVVNLADDSIAANITFPPSNCGAYPDSGIAYDPASGYVYVSTLCQISVIDPVTESIVGNLTTGQDATAGLAVYDTVNQAVYFNGPGNGVTEISQSRSGLTGPGNQTNGTVTHSGSSGDILPGVSNGWFLLGMAGLVGTLLAIVGIVLWTRRKRKRSPS